MIHKASDSLKKALFVIPILILIYIFSCEEIEYFKKPTVKTIRVENTTSSSTNAIGEIVNLEDNDIIDFGFCWSVNNKPTKEGSYISIDLKLLDNVFNHVIDEFEHGQQYYIRAFATNEVGTGYGDEISFITDDGNIIITTTEITNITPISAISGGNITDDGGASVTERGICWNTTGNPIITDSIKVEGDGTGSFIINLSGLNVGTKHYVRAYATNEVGTSYGNEINFTTKDGLAILSTSDVSNITSTTSTSGGNITDDSGFAVTTRGVCWSTSSNPTTEDTHTTEGNETDNFESEITGLTEGTSYYVRAYATNENGTAYGEELIFMSNIVDFDGNEYAIVKIGEQIWMAENMSAIHYANGTPLVDGSGVGHIWDDTTSKYYFSYNDNEDNVATYGRLYTWAAAINGLLSSVTYSMGVQGICPDGWHMPGDAEWKELEMYLGMSQEDADNFGIRGTDEGNKLKSTSGWNSDGNGTNESGFSALPSGYRGADGFYEMYNITYFWSGIDDHDGNPLARRLVFDEGGVGSDGIGRDNGFNVRCIKGVASPSVTTSVVSDITETSATVGGNITSGGGVTVTENGIYYSTTANPENTGTKLQIGSGIGEFSSSLTGLTPSTTYYIKAYATNSIGTSYGNEVTFTTIITPTLTTIAINYIEANSAQSGGNITDDGGAEVTDRGVCYNTSPNPDINDYTVHDGNNGIGVFNCSIGSLMPETIYYLRAFATNSIGTGYGNEILFKTMSGTVTDFDGNTYFTVIIGAQEWMAENLNTTHFADGTEIALAESNWGSLDYTDKAYCYYDNSIDTYGALYNWAAAMNGAESSDANPSGVQGVCPNGWYMPGDSEWKELEVYLGMSPTDADAIGWRGTDEGSKLKSKSGWGSDDDGINNSGFTALPGGCRDQAGPFENLSMRAQFWSATEYNSSRVWIRSLGYKDPGVTRYNNNMLDGYSVRCLKGAVYPIVTTSSVSDVAEISATVGGDVTANGGAAVTERGVYYGTIANPEIDGTKLPIGSGIGEFSTSLTSLSSGTIYYIKAYATNSIGTSYGSQESFTTLVATPTVTTSSVSNIAEISATVGGNVTADGGATVTESGIYYSTTSSPETSGTKLAIGSGTGEFSTSLTGLPAGTVYFIKAYATNSAGTSYGSEETFTTLTTPSLTTTEITNITVTTATSGGNITDDGGTSITERGVCWNLTGTPTISDSPTSDGSGTGNYVSALSSLNPNTHYFIRAYAINSVGTSYGNEFIFKSMNSTMTDIDGNEYFTTMNGAQEWMSENLKTTHYADGGEITLVENASAWSLLANTDTAYCYYDNLSTNGDAYGALYTWAAATNGISSDANPSGIQGACPDGWHLPSDDEWKQLEIFLGMNSADADLTNMRGTDEGSKLKATSGWNYDGNGTNESGFTALSSGFRVYNGTFYNMGEQTDFWSTTEQSISNAWRRGFDYGYSGVDRNYVYKDSGMSIRCIKN